MNRMIQQDMSTYVCLGQIYTMQYEQDDSAGNGQINPALSIYIWEIPVVTGQLRMLLIVLLINTMQGTNSNTPT